MLGGKVGITLLNVVTCFANDFEITNHSILNEMAFQKSKLIQIRDIRINTLNGFKNLR